jgi:hypothetical protein
MTFKVMETRVLNNVQDPNNDIFGTAEVADAVNDAKDQCLSLIRMFTDQFPQTSLDVVFAADDRIKPVANCLKILRIEYTPSGASVTVSGGMRSLQQQDQAVFDTDFWPEITATGVYNIARRITTEARTVTVIYVAKVVDLVHDVTTEFTFGPPPVDNLIVVKATMTLLAARNRMKGMAFWVKKEMQLTQQLQDNAQDIDGTGPRYVHMSDDEVY